MKRSFRLKEFMYSKTCLFIAGLSATLWFLIRVIPKPSRARYPCMQAAAPFMSSFVIYLISLYATAFTFKKFKQSLYSSRYLVSAVFLIICILSYSVFIIINNKTAIAYAFNPADNTFPVASNEPVGLAKGLFPGRVVWVHDDRATNENYVPLKNSTSFWYSNDNASEEVIKEMLSSSILHYTEKHNPAEAWDALFKSFNLSAGRGEKGYTPGEKIAFKINLTNQSSGESERPQRMDVAPQLLNAILHELVHNAGVAESDIILGDPYREFRTEYKALVRSKYPQVKYVDGKGGDGILQTVPSVQEVLVFSDKMYKSTLPQQFLDATYIINMPCLKSHNEGGITLISKNHQGSYLEKGNPPETQLAMKVHYSLPANSPGAGKYRHTIDYMGHRDTGGKTFLYIIDGIWGGESWEGWIKKFKSGPFHDDYPNSLFISQDPVALESVCFDVLFQEYVLDNSKQDYPIRYKVEIADYLAQCASSNYWPAGILYDPEGDGIPLESLGVFEHWNNPTDRQYSRNLGTGQGIELKYFKSGVTGLWDHTAQTTYNAAPNPFSDYTRFTRSEMISNNTVLEIYTPGGTMIKSWRFKNSREIIWNGTDFNNNPLPDGIYFYKIQDNPGQKAITGKIILSR